MAENFNLLAHSAFLLLQNIIWILFPRSILEQESLFHQIFLSFEQICLEPNTTALSLLYFAVLMLFCKEISDFYKI